MEEAKTVFDKPESIEVDGRVLVIEFASSSPQHCKADSTTYIHIKAGWA